MIRPPFIFAISRLASAGIIVFLCSILYGLGQHITVSGQITDAATGEPLVGASVSVLKLGVGVYAAEEGRYSLNVSTAGQEYIEIFFSYAGYANQTFTINDLSQTSVTQNIELEPEGFTTEDVVITATKGFAQAQSDVTMSIEVIRPLSIDLQATPTIDKAISQIPGVDNQDGQINIRGSSGYAYGTGSRVMVTLDGLPLITGDAGTANLDLIPVDNISQVEVMKGASSVLYGSSALGGVINISTADPGPEPTTSIRLRYGMYGPTKNKALDWDGDKNAWSASAHIFHSRKIGKEVDFTLQSNFIKETGYRKGTDTEEYRNMFMFRYKPAKVSGLTLGFNASVSVDSSGQILYWKGYYPDTVIENNQTIISGGALTPTDDNGGFRKQMSTVIGLDPVIKYLTPNGKSLLWYRGRYLQNSNSNNTNQSS